jgi:hypothetical protein
MHEPPRRRRDRLNVFIEQLLVPFAAAVTIIGVVLLLLSLWRQ